MKKYLILWVSSFLCAGPLGAQTFKEAAANSRRTVSRATLERFARTAANETRTAQRGLAGPLNKDLYERLSVLFEERQIPLTVPVQQFPQDDIPLAFMLQENKVAKKGTASAFAIEEDGHLLGVTAAHVLDNIKNNPYMLVQIAQGMTESFPIFSWRNGNAFNVDIAVFEIPEEAKPFVRPLPVAEQPLQAHQAVSIAGYTKSLPLWFEQEEVLFVGAQRALVRSSIPEVYMGTCGGPVLVDGKVVGIYAGLTNTKEDPTPQKWTRPLSLLSNKPLPTVHQVILIDQAVPFVQSLLDGTETAASTELKVLGYPVTLLGPEDHLVEINLMRDGDIIQSVYAGPLADPEHLEQFLHIQTDDTLTVSILRQDERLQIYLVEINTGKVINLL